MNFTRPSKLPQVGTNIFTRMSALAQQHQAINLSQGFPDFACDPALVNLATEAMQHNHNQYAPMPGLPALRQKIAGLQHRWYGATYDPVTEVTITCGASEALMASMLAFVQPGEEVIILEPSYDSYLPAIALSGGKAVPVPLSLPDYHIDWQRVADAISPRTTAILINSPHNPSGTMISADDLTELARLAERHDLLVISDEVYEHIRFDAQPHHSISSHPELAARSIVVSSFGKSLHTTGWKVGYCMAPAALSAEIRKVHQFITFSTSTPFQHAILHYLEDHLHHIEGLGLFYQAKRDLFLDLMKDSRFTPLPCTGTYFQLMRYDQISEQSEMEFAEWLTREQGVAAVPVSAFYQQARNQQVVRFCFAKQDATLQAAAARLCAI
jgi:methionine aminotransferase